MPLPAGIRLSTTYWQLGENRELRLAISAFPDTNIAKNNKSIRISILESPIGDR
jgi:hypothetical protein